MLTGDTIISYQSKFSLPRHELRHDLSSTSASSSTKDVEAGSNLRDCKLVFTADFRKQEIQIPPDNPW